MKGKIRVYCRLRPLTPKEMSDKENSALASVDEFTVQHLGRDEKIKQHCYDRVFDGNATQEDVFNDTRASLKNHLFDLFVLFLSSLYVNLISYKLV